MVGALCAQQDGPVLSNTFVNVCIIIHAPNVVLIQVERKWKCPRPRGKWVNSHYVNIDGTLNSCLLRCDGVYAGLASCTYPNTQSANCVHTEIIRHADIVGASGQTERGKQRRWMMAEQCRWPTYLSLSAYDGCVGCLENKQPPPETDNLEHFGQFTLNTCSL